jgi:two-component system, NtrC family, sensor kinase
MLATHLAPEPVLPAGDRSLFPNLDSLPVHVWLVDDTGRMVYANRPFLTATGIAVGTVAPWGRFLDDDAAWEFQGNWSRAQQSGRPIECEARVRLHDGEFRWHLLRLNPGTGSDGRRLWHGTATDVHAQREISREIEALGARLEAELKRRSVDSTGRSIMSMSSGERYRKRSELLHEILDSLLEAVVVFDAQGQVLLFNTAARDLYGPGVLTGRSDEWPTRLNLWHLDGVTPVPADDYPAARALQGEATAELEVWVQGPAGRRRCAARGIPLWDGSGGVRGGVTVLRDMTDARRTEEQLAHLQKLEAIGNLAAGIAHEINTPIQYVGDNLRFLGGAFRDLDAPTESVDVDFLRAEVPAAIEQSLQGVDRVAAIVRAVREFAAPGPDEPTAVSLNRVAENAVAVTRNVWKYAAEVEVVCDPGLPAVPGHARDLSQSVYHLLMNAVEAVQAVHPAGAGRITLATRTVADGVILTVTDNGCGIGKAMRARVFDPFFSTKPPGKHSGQGLTRVLGCVVKRHHGTVELASEPGVGTTVTIRLPFEWPED